MSRCPVNRKKKCIYWRASPLKKNMESFELKTNIAFLLTLRFPNHIYPDFPGAAKMLGVQMPIKSCFFGYHSHVNQTESRESGIGSVIPVQLHFNLHAGLALRCWCDPGFYPLTVINLAALRGGCRGHVRACVFVSRRWVLHAAWRIRTRPLIDLWQENALLIRHCFIIRHCRDSRLGLARFNGWKNGGVETEAEGKLKCPSFFYSLFIHSSH